MCAQKKKKKNCLIIHLAFFIHLTLFHLTVYDIQSFKNLYEVVVTITVVVTDISTPTVSSKYRKIK